jgi:hypothetical protein
VSNPKPPHVPPSPPVAPPLQATLHALLTHPVSASRSLAPPAFEVRQAWVQVSSEQPWMHK